MKQRCTDTVTKQRKNSSRQLTNVPLSVSFSLSFSMSISPFRCSQDRVSNLAPKILSPKEITGNRDTPFERLRKQVRESVLEDERRLKQSKLIAECERLSRLNKNDKIK